MKTLAIFLLCLPLAALASELPDPVRQAELRHLLDQDCGSCHGLTLQGGLGPALLPRTLSGKPAESLAWTILQGRPGTAMPPWKTLLSEADARWLAEELLKGVE